MDYVQARVDIDRWCRKSGRQPLIEPLIITDIIDLMSIVPPY